jgi:ketol-acid reductoisomerase
MARHGIAGMMERISDTAEWGAYQAGPEIVGRESREAMARVLNRIRSGEFARGWLEEARAGKKNLLEARDTASRRPAQSVFERLSTDLKT